MPKSDLVLLALDDEQIIQLFDRALTAVSYHVAIARDHAALNKSLQESSPALVIISQNFNGADELEIAAGMLERFPTMPVLLLLLQDSPEIVRKAIHVGVSDCLYAPLHIEEIMKTVENSIKRADRIGDWTRREVNRTTASLQQRLDELQKLDTIVEHIEDGVIILDEQSNLLLINPAARKAFGLWQNDAVKGKPVSEVLPHPDLKILLSDINNPLPQNEITFEDGRVLSAQCTPIPRIGVAITMQDITYLKQIDRLKNEFVHTVSHDLRSPLTAILGYVDLLDRVGPVNDQQREFIRRVQNSVQSITSLVNDLLELGRIEAGFDTQKEVVPLEGIIRDTLETLGGQISDKKMNLHLNLPMDIPQMRGNPIRLRQMLDNLIGNAIKYTPEGGEITIDVEAQNDQVILRISDTGPGIPPADQLHIFEKFYRASNVPKGVGGSGLGLSIVKSIVENHQGRIWVESLLGQGSAFTVVLPLYKQAVAQPA
ncbi:MAG: PAS domain-containing protein [Chloroflexi bacterium]|nr:MAG: PAS domain-containing protein [Chloroflexota bacterium]